MGEFTVEMRGLLESPAGRRASWLSRYTLLPGVLVALLCLPMLVDMVRRQIFDVPGSNDYVVHLQLAITQQLTGQPQTPHFLYQTLLSATGGVFQRMPVENDMIVWGVVISIASMFIVLHLLDWGLGPARNYRIGLLLALLAGMTLLLWEINIFSVIWERTGKPWVVGYIRFNSYHNPTLLLLRPLALLLSVAVLHIFRREGKPLAQTGVIATLVVLTCLAKPNYALALVPGVLILVAYRLVRRQGRTVNWLLLTGGLLIPVGLMLAWQYLFTYTTGFRTGIGFNLFGIYIRWGLFDWLLPIRYLLTVLFPLGAALLYFRAARQSLYLTLSWASFAMAVIQANVLIELGPTAFDGNFTWGLHITVYILFIASLLFFLKQNHIPQRPARALVKDWRFITGSLLLGMHFINGLAFFVYRGL